MPGMSGVGISFGADRIFDVMNQLELYPEEVSVATQVLFVNFGDKEAAHCLKLAAELRSKGIKTEVYPDNAKMKKQMAYADKKQIGYVALLGENEIAKGLITLKDMHSGEQSSITLNEVVERIKA